MSNEDRKERETLNELKERLWTKIQITDAKLRSLDEKSDEYRKTLDGYHKIVKSYVDIVKVQHYAPGSLVQDSKEGDDDFAKLMKKFKAGEALAPADKVALQEFKEFLDYTSKVTLGTRRKKGGVN